MNKMRVKKGLGNIVANVIRQMALVGINSLRPIAITVGQNSNVISAGENVVEDMIQICSNLNSLHYEVLGNLDFDSIIIFHTKINNGVLKSSDLKDDKFHAVSDTDRELLHVLNGHVDVTIYFRYTSNVCTKDDNILCLENNGIDTSTLVVTNSRHSDVLNFAYKIKTDDFFDTIEFDIKTPFKDLDVLTLSIKNLKENLNLK